MKVEALRELLRLAECAGVPARVLRVAAAELVAISEALAIDPDWRRVATVRRGRRIEALLEAGVEPVVIREELGGISEFAYRRALRAVRDLRTVDGIQGKAGSLEDEIA